ANGTQLGSQKRGALGTLARYGISTAFPVTPQQIPWATLVINLSGSFLLGFMLSVVERLPPNRFVRPFLAVGVLGGFTTFSTFAVEVVQLFHERPWIAISYLATSGGLGVLCALVGSMAVRGFYPRSLDRLSKGE
ncbi:MAG: CrcB family protein, partial [Actinomycetota bacterium]